MDADETQQERPRRRRWAPIGLLIGGLLAGGILAGTVSAGAQEATPSASASASATTDHGPGETLLTGSKADRAEAAALEEFPGATVIRVETDSGDASYEAHLERSDGSRITVLLDENFNVTGTETGFGNCPHDDASDSSAA